MVVSVLCCSDSNFPGQRRCHQNIGVAVLRPHIYHTALPFHSNYHRISRYRLVHHVCLNAVFYMYPTCVQLGQDNSTWTLS